MLYKFKSKAAGDVIMLEPTGRRILGIIGKDPGAKGIILPREMAAAQQALQAAIALEDEQQRQAQAQGEPVPRDDAVSLRQRAAPFLDMLRRCAAADREIVWGV